MNKPLLALALAFGIASVASVQAQTPAAAGDNDNSITHGILLTTQMIGRHSPTASLP